MNWIERERELSEGLQTRPHLPASASGERMPVRSSDSALDRRFNELVTGMGEFLSLARLISR